MQYDINDLMTHVQAWLTTGVLVPTILSDDFLFTSPYWKQANKVDFVSKFLDATEYVEKSLSKITHFDTIYAMRDDKNACFTLVLKYHTKNGNSVDEAVFCRIEKGLIIEMRSIYDLAATKEALEL
tara:strand:- start:1189 stop:1566 length:378 start_codon:yes stop_codon:yes gene_type:complete